MKEKNNTKKYVLIGIILMLIGALLITSDYLKSKKYKAYETINLALSKLPTYIEEDNTDNEEPNQNQEENDEPKNTQDTVTYKYIGTLEIPKISFSKGFVDKNTSANNVDYNIEILKQSDYPNISKGNFIIAGHSGNGWNSFFKDLYQLEINDKAYVYYNNKKYTYNIVDIYYQPKTGKLKIYRDHNKTTMTLITCTKNDKTTQTVYILELEKTEKY